MTLERWRPSLMRRRPMSEEIERMMDEFLAGWPGRWQRFPTAQMGWAPPMEMYEKDGTYVIKMDLPGVNKEDVDVSITGDTLTVKGERKSSEEVKEEDYYRSETCYGSFARSIVLPASVDPNQVEATYDNGVLELHVPKSKEAMPSKIEIKPK